MGMSRHIYWLILLNMLANVVAYVPRILLAERFTGMVLAIPIATFIGTVLLFWQLSTMSYFPQKGLPELLKEHVPKWFRISILSVMAGGWFFAGFITLIAFSDITKRFINPDMNSIVISLLFGLVIGGGVLLQTKTLLFLLEIFLFINLPFVTMVFLKAYSNDFFNWDMVRLTLTHFYELPSWTAISSAFYTFLGFSNLIIFNRAIPELERKWLWLVPIAGLVNLFTTAFVPIGMLGTNLVGNMIFPWFSTADTLRMEFGFVERVLFIFLLIYIGISLISVMVHWHVSVECLKSILPPICIKGRSYLPILALAIFLFIISASSLLLNTPIVYHIARMWMSTVIPIAVLVNILLTWMKRRQRA